MNINIFEHLYEGGGSFWMDVLISFIGAFFGLLFALLINRLIENKERKNQKKLKKGQDIERLHYLAIILKSTVKTAKIQTSNYSELSHQVKENLLKMFYPRIVVTFDGWRLRNLDSIELFDSYVSIFNDQENNIKDYKNIFAHGDYMFEKLNEAKNQNEKHRNFQHKDSLFVRDCIEEIYTSIGLRCKNFLKNYGAEAQKIDEYIYLHSFEIIYKSVSQGEADLTRIKDEYFNPLHDTILQNIQDVNFADFLFTIIKKALGRLQNIEFNSLDFARDMENLEEETKETIEYLEIQMKKIEEKIKL